jgi:hypothetical protein
MLVPTLWAWGDLEGTTTHYCAGGLLGLDSPYSRSNRAQSRINICSTRIRMRPSLVLPLSSKYGISFSRLYQGVRVYTSLVAHDHQTEIEAVGLRSLLAIIITNPHQQVYIQKGDRCSGSSACLKHIDQYLAACFTLRSAIGPRHQSTVIYLPQCSSASLCVGMVAPVYPGYAASFSTIISSLFY